MIKKKLNILLLLLLALLFTSLLGTTSFASQYMITYEDIETITNRVPIYTVNVTEATCKQRLWNKVQEYQETYDTIAFYIYGNDTNRFCYVYGFNKAWITSVSDINNLNYAKIRVNQKYKRYSVTDNSELLRSTSYAISLGSGAQLDTRYHIWTNDLGEYADGPQDNPNILTFSTPDYFIYAPSSLIDEIDLNGSYYFSDTAQIINFVRDMSGNVNEADAVVPGYISLAKNFDYANFDSWSYNVTTGKYEATGEHWTQTTLGTIESDIIDVTFSALNWGTLYKADTIIHAEFVPKSRRFSKPTCLLLYLFTIYAS